MNQATKTPSLIEPQRWKLWLFGFLLAVSGIGFFAPNPVASVVGSSPVMVSLAAVGIGCIVLVGAALSVRCPSCGLSLAWYALSKQAHNAWLSWLLDTKVCPRCGFSHSAGQGGSNE